MCDWLQAAIRHTTVAWVPIKNGNIWNWSRYCADMEQETIIDRRSENFIVECGIAWPMARSVIHFNHRSYYIGRGTHASLPILPQAQTEICNYMKYIFSKQAKWEILSLYYINITLVIRHQVLIFKNWKYQQKQKIQFFKSLNFVVLYKNVSSDTINFFYKIKVIIILTIIS